MSKKRKSPQIDETKVESQEVSYRVFFSQCVTKGLVKPWQEKEIHAFFKDIGLTDQEPEDTYKDALAKY